MYKTKESQVTLAENDQENELKELNQNLETQSIENINSTFMNCNLFLFLLFKLNKHGLR